MKGSLTHTPDPAHAHIHTRTSPSAWKRSQKIWFWRRHYGEREKEEYINTSLIVNRSHLLNKTRLNRTILSIFFTFCFLLLFTCCNEYYRHELHQDRNHKTLQSLLRLKLETWILNVENRVLSSSESLFALNFIHMYWHLHWISVCLHVYLHLKLFRKYLTEHINTQTHTLICRNNLWSFLVMLLAFWVKF